MKKALTAILSALICAIFAVNTHAFSEDEVIALLKEDLTRCGNNSHPYVFHPIQDTPAPEGYSPFYISHYARHGTRVSLDKTMNSSVVDKLRSAESRGLLTDEGRKILEQAEKENELFRGDVGQLLPLGRKEHETIARRMYERYPSVFDDGRLVRAVSSSASRSIMSMSAFCVGLARCKSDIRLDMDEGKSFFKYIAPASPDISTWRFINKTLGKLPKDTTTFATRIFKNPSAAREIIPNFEKLQKEIVQVGFYSANYEIEDHCLDVIPFDYLYRTWLKQNLGFSLHMGCCEEFGPGKAPYLVPLLKDFVEKADQAIASGQVCANLRFGHDYPLMEFMGLIGMSGVGDKMPADRICRDWLAFQHVTMASNTQWIFYRNARGKVLVKFLYQEKESRLNALKPFKGPYYRWEDVKKYFAGITKEAEDYVREHPVPAKKK